MSSENIFGKKLFYVFIKTVFNLNTKQKIQKPTEKIQNKTRNSINKHNFRKCSNTYEIFARGLNIFVGTFLNTYVLGIW